MSNTRQDTTSLRDPQSFRFYLIEDVHTNDLETSWMENKRSSIIKSVVSNDVGALKHLMDFPEFLRIVDKNGLTLLHIAILTNARDAFDYLLSFPDCPLEVHSDYGETPLLTAIYLIDVGRDGRIKPGSDYFSLNLLTRANVFQTDKLHNTTLSCCALKHHIHMAETLIRNGVDVGAQDVYGDTALHYALEHEGVNRLEFITFLLLNGADPRIKNNNNLNPFDKSVLYTKDSHLQEVLFYFTYDCHSEYTVEMNVLLRLAKHRSDLVLQFEDAVIEKEPRDDYLELFHIDTDYLLLLAQKFTSMNGVIPMCSLHEWSRNAVSLEKIEALISVLKDSMVSRIQMERDYVLLQNLIDGGLDLHEITQVMMYFASYGLSVSDKCLQAVFNQFGRCGLFNTLLYMDVEIIGAVTEIFPALLYDVTADLQSCLENCSTLSMRDAICLLECFCNQALRKICVVSLGDTIAKRTRNFSDIPLLQELARNVFRKYFVQRLEITTPKSFYTLVNNLDISNVFKKIITLERSLYQV